MATIREIAKRVGFSQATVSRVLKDDPTFSVKDSTREKILNASLEMGYKNVPQYQRITIPQDVAILDNVVPDKGLQDAYFDELREMAKDDDRVIFLGFVQGQLLAELYSNAYTYVLPSDVEGMPLSLMEAMSYGCCVLTSDIDERLRRSGARRDLPPRRYRRFTRKAGGFAGESGEGGKVQGGSAGLHLPFAQLGHGDAAEVGGLSRGCAAGRAASGFAAGSAGG